MKRFLSVLFVLSLSAAAVAQTPTLTTDKPKYEPGDTITFKGADWAPGEAVTIVVSAESSDQAITLKATADNAGSFNVTTEMPDDGVTASAVAAGPHLAVAKPNEHANFHATAKGNDSQATAEVAFSEGELETDGERLLQLEDYWQQRLTYPTGKFNPGWVRKAAQDDKKVTRGTPKGKKRGKRSLLAVTERAGAIAPLALDDSGFIALGPKPELMSGCSGCFNYTTTSGRVNTIVIDPTTTTDGSIVAYAGTVGGGVWKTTNCCSATTEWTVVTDDPLISTTTIDALTIDPNDHDTIYAGTGDLNYGSFSMGSQGVLKSTDGGATWTVLGGDIFGPALPEPAGQFPQYQAVGKVRVDPNDSHRVVAGAKTGLYFSYDGGANWTGPCLTNTFTSMRQDITGLELTDMGGGVTRILAAVGVRGFSTTVQFNLGQNGANGIYSGNMPASGCPSFTPITSNANGFVFGPAVSGSPYTAGAALNATSGAAYVSATSGNQLGRIEITVAPSDPNVLYAQVQSIALNSNGGCGNAAGCQLGVFASVDGGATWTMMTGSAGGSLRDCTNASGDYPQNWYDQALAVDPNNSDRLFISTFDVWHATRTGTAFNDITCGYSYPGNAGPVHVDQHALAFLPGSSSTLLIGNDGGVHGTVNAHVSTNATDPTWFNADTGMNTIEFYSGDISGDFANSATPAASGGAQDNGPSSVLFSGSPTGPAPWQMGLGGDGFYSRIDPQGTRLTSAIGTIAMTGGATAGQTFTIATQTFTFQSTPRTAAGQVQLNNNAGTQATNVVNAINADIPNLASAVRSLSGATNSAVVVTAAAEGAGTSVPFTEAVNNMTMNGGGFLGGTHAGGLPGSLRFWQGNNSGGLSRCIGVNTAATTFTPCTTAGAQWISKRGGWTNDQQSFILPFEIFHGDPSNPANDCGAPGGGTGCGHLVAGTVRVWETITGAAPGTNGVVTWYVNSPANLTKSRLGNRSFINQLAFEPKMQSVVMVGTNDGAVQIGRNMGTGSNQSIWTDLTDDNNTLPNRPVLDVAFDPTTTTAPIGYAAVGGFNANTPATPGHVFRVTCTLNCATFGWDDRSGNLPDIPVDSIIANPNFPPQVFAGTDFGLYFTDDITANPVVWTRFNNGLPNVMIWDMQIDRGATTLSLWTRGRGAFVWPLPTGPESPLPTILSASGAAGTYGGTTTLTALLTSGGNPVPTKTINFSLNGTSVGAAVTDGTGTATLPDASLAGIHAGDYPAGVTASFAGDDVYAAASDTDALSVDRKAITGSITASNKEYDGTTAATIATRSLAGVVGTDVVSYTGGTATFADANVGTAIAVNATGLGLSGADADNYTVNSTASTTADITKAPLTVAANDAARLYSYPNPLLTASYSGFKNGETLATSGVTGAPVLTTTATETSPIGAYPIVVSIGTLDAHNYSFTLVNGTLRVLISGIVGVDSVFIGSTKALADSFDSAGGYPATAGSNAIILSNGTIEVSGAKISGNVLSALGSVLLGPNSSVSGNVTAGTTITNQGTAGSLTPNHPSSAIVAAPVPACGAFTLAPGLTGGKFTYSNGDLSVASGSQVTLANGSYCFHSVTLGGNATLQVGGPVVINLTGVLNAGGGALVNATKIPANLQIASSFTGAGGVAISGNTSGYLTIYAPGTSVTVSGGSPVFGALLGKTLTISGNSQVHYDVQLPQIWSGFGF